MSADSPRRIEDEVDELEALLQPGREDDLKTFLLLLHPADVADLITEVNEATSVQVLRHLEEDRAAELLSELDPDDQVRLLSLIKPQKLARIVGEMESDDIADFLQNVPEAQAQDLLGRLPEDEREDVTELLGYDPESAGGIMQTELVMVREHQTISEVLDAVREEAEEIDILSVFVVDDKKRYLGNISLQDLIFARPSRSAAEVMEPKVVEVTTDVDQEEVAQIFDHYALVELAVVDRVGRLRGRITADDVHEVLVEEADEDMMLMAGAGDAIEAVYSNDVLRVAGTRMPWLLATFLGGLVATWILNAASVVFNTVVVLLTFVPVITGMSGNVGTQSAMIMIRGLAVGHVEDDDLRATIGRDFLVGLIIATTCATAVTLVVGLWKSSWALGLCVGLSLGTSMTAASVLGSVEPVVLKRFGIDPAIAAGPLITSINDITGVAIYATIAKQFLGLLSA
jgi:magnesium transporter